MGRSSRDSRLCHAGEQLLDSVIGRAGTAGTSGCDRVTSPRNSACRRTAPGHHYPANRNTDRARSNAFRPVVPLSQSKSCRRIRCLGSLAGSLRGFPAGFTLYICRYAVNGAECGLVLSFSPAPLCLRERERP